MELKNAHLQLLRLLKDRDSEMGVFFARWDEIRSNPRTEQWMQDNQDAPNLNWETERLMLDMKMQDFAEELENLGTPEGKHYRITPYGIEALEASQLSAVSKKLPSIHRGLKWLVLSLVASWLLYLFGPELGIFEVLENAWHEK